MTATHPRVANTVEPATEWSTADLGWPSARPVHSRPTSASLIETIFVAIVVALITITVIVSALLPTRGPSHSSRVTIAPAPAMSVRTDPGIGAVGRGY
jgi:hypothetical protein